LFSVAIIGILLFITGAYRFSLLLTGNRTVAGYTALLAVFFFFVCRNASYFWAATQYYRNLCFDAFDAKFIFGLKPVNTNTFFFDIIISGYGLLSSYTPLFGMIFHLSAHWNGNHGYLREK
jgi:hypothetical protein